MQTAPARELTHQYMVQRAKETHTAIDRFVHSAEPSLIVGLVDETLKETARELMESVFEPFTHPFMSALDVDVDNLRSFMLVAYDCRSSIADIFEEACERHRNARYTRRVAPHRK